MDPAPPAAQHRMTRRALDLLRAGAGAALGLVYPPSCIACGGATEAAHGLCAGCWSGLRLIERPFCERLGTPFPADTGRAPVARRDRRPAGLPPGPGGGPYTTRPPGSWCTGSNTATGSNSRRRSARRWPGRARNSCARPTRSCRCRCTVAPVVAALQPGDGPRGGGRRGRAACRPTPASLRGCGRRQAGRADPAQRRENLEGALRVPEGARPASPGGWSSSSTTCSPRDRPRTRPPALSCGAAPLGRRARLRAGRPEA